MYIHKRMFKRPAHSWRRTEEMLALCLLVLALVAGVTSTPFEVCPGVPPMKSLNFIGCSALPCKFVRGTEEEFIFEIITKKSVSKLSAKVQAFVLGTETVFPLPSNRGDVCANLLDGECPLDAEEDVHYKLVMPISQMYPLIALVVQFSIVTETGETVGCLRMPASVVDP